MALTNCSISMLTNLQTNGLNAAILLGRIDRVVVMQAYTLPVGLLSTSDPQPPVSYPVYESFTGTGFRSDTPSGDSTSQSAWSQTVVDWQACSSERIHRRQHDAIIHGKRLVKRETAIALPGELPANAIKSMRSCSEEPWSALRDGHLPRGRG